MENLPFTIVITSCGRFDLLEQTLVSLFRNLDEEPSRSILIEDSGDRSVLNVAGGFPVDVYVNDQKLGQMASIDKAYAMVDTPLIFHCEDDWRFTRSGFLGSSRRLLATLEDVSMVGLRRRETLNPLLRRLPVVAADEPKYFMTDPTAHPEYFSYSFNPGLRRTDDARQLGPFSTLGHEADVSFAFKKKGFRMAYLEEPAIEHLGDNRHIDDPMAPKRPTNHLERLTRSMEKRVKRFRRAVAKG
ncbi:MAG: hypothetical protein AAF668_05015 [Pseudomonadota bacterium]